MEEEEEEEEADYNKFGITKKYCDSAKDLCKFHPNPTKLCENSGKATKL